MSAMVDKANFSEWLEKELEKRDMSQSELARQAGVTRAAINGVLTGARGPGIDLCNGIAQAFKLPPEEVYRAAGIPLSPERNGDPLTQEGIYILQKLEGENKKDAIRYLQLRLQVQEERDKKNGRKRKERPSTT